MKCPVCTNSTLLMTERQGVEIDYCPVCRGIWLDRGELDKLLAHPNDQANSHQDFRDSDIGKRQEHDRHSQHGYNPVQGHRRKSWLQEIFD